jgi:hypothetical protein
MDPERTVNESSAAGLLLLARPVERPCVRIRPTTKNASTRTHARVALCRWGLLGGL